MSRTTSLEGMAEFMREDFRAIYDNPAGTRRAIISRGRKNAKTTESAMILLLLVVFAPEGLVGLIGKFKRRPRAEGKPGDA